MLGFQNRLILPMQSRILTLSPLMKYAIVIILADNISNGLFIKISSHMAQASSVSL